jgi:hypothetical protein
MFAAARQPWKTLSNTAIICSYFGLFTFISIFEVRFLSYTAGVALSKITSPLPIKPALSAAIKSGNRV